MSFDKIFDLTAGVYFFYKYCINDVPAYKLRRVQCQSGPSVVYGRGGTFGRRWIVASFPSIHIYSVTSNWLYFCVKTIKRFHVLDVQQ